MNNLSSHGNKILKDFNPFKNFKLENYKYAQLHKDHTSENFSDSSYDYNELLKISHNLQKTDFEETDLSSKVDKWNFNSVDSYFRVSSLSSRSSLTLNLDSFSQEVLLVDVNHFNENISFTKNSSKNQTLILITSNISNPEPRSVFFDLAENSNLEILQLALSNNRSFIYFEIDQSDFSKMNFITFQSNNNHIRNEYYASLGEKCELNLLGLNFKNNFINDNFSYIQHLKPSTASNEIFKSIVDNGAITNFQGKIYVDPIAQKTDGYQMSRSLLLDSKSKANNKPELEIYADDVKCSHGSTVAKLSQNQIYYFKTRGIDEQTAKNILQKAFLVEIIESLQNKEIKDFSMKLLDNLI